MERWGERSVLSVPLVFKDEGDRRDDPGGRSAPLGGSRPTTYASSELMAVPAAVAVHTARMLRREAEQARRLGALLSASRAMTATIDLDQLLAAIAHEARVALDRPSAPSTPTTRTRRP